jgi:hypothetical protein
MEKNMEYEHSTPANDGLPAETYILSQLPPRPLDHLRNTVSIPTLPVDELWDRMGGSMIEPQQSIVTIAMLASKQLRGKFLESTDEVKSLHDRMEALLGNAKESARTFLDGMNDTNRGAFKAPLNTCGYSYSCDISS